MTTISRSLWDITPPEHRSGDPAAGTAQIRRGSRLTPVEVIDGPLFPLGRTLATPGALDAGVAAGQGFDRFLERHQSGDWGGLDDYDIAANDHAVDHGQRILSAYDLANGTIVWIVTEADRHATVVLLPTEY